MRFLTSPVSASSDEPTRATAGAREEPAGTEPKRWHGPHSGLRQAPYVAAVPDPAPPLVLIVDDLCTSGHTMRLSLEAVRKAGVPAFGFAFSGV
jgi:hypothetical protein